LVFYLWGWVCFDILFFISEFHFLFLLIFILFSPACLYMCNWCFPLRCLFQCLFVCLSVLLFYFASNCMQDRKNELHLKSTCYVNLLSKLSIIFKEWSYSDILLYVLTATFNCSLRMFVKHQVLILLFLKVLFLSAHTAHFRLLPSGMMSM
jgi:hypothetical protein